MKTKIVEAAHSRESGNWGKFLIGVPDEAERSRKSAVSSLPAPLLHQRGWSRRHIWVLDLETGEGAFFAHGGLAQADLQQHRIWVCPLFEPFLQWLYTQDITDISALPDVVYLPHAPFSDRGYRRPGPGSGPECVPDAAEVA